MTEEQGMPEGYFRLTKKQVNQIFKSGIPKKYMLLLLGETVLSANWKKRLVGRPCRKEWVQDILSIKARHRAQRTAAKRAKSQAVRPPASRTKRQDIAAMRYVAEKNGRTGVEIRGKVAELEWKQLRYSALKKANGRCACCGSRAADGVTLHVDHIVPRAVGGKDRLDNLQVLCASCNEGKGSWDSTDWRS